MSVKRKGWGLGAMLYVFVVAYLLSLFVAQCFGVKI